MTVGELITELQRCDSSLEVIISAKSQGYTPLHGITTGSFAFPSAMGGVFIYEQAHYPFSDEDSPDGQPCLILWQRERSRR